MVFERQTQYHITCDVCEDAWSAHANDRRISLEEFRSDGWKIGKKCVCSDCAKKKKDVHALEVVE